MRAHGPSVNSLFVKEHGYLNFALLMISLSSLIVLFIEFLYFNTRAESKRSPYVPLLKRYVCILSYIKWRISAALNDPLRVVHS